MAKRAKMRRFKVLTAIGALFVAGVVLLTLPDCDKLRALIVNDSSSELEDVTLSIRGRVVWSGRLDTSEGRRIAVAVRANDPFLLTGRYAKTGIRFEGYSSYARYYDRRIHVFVIDEDGVHPASWFDPPLASSEEPGVLSNASRIGALFLDVMSCADHALWTSIRGSPEY